MNAAAPIVVIGAGAAGLTAAIFAATGERRVMLIERTKDGGRKILISGGGRCNVLPSSLSASRYFTASSANALRNMLMSWPLPEQRRFFEHELSIPLALESATGKLFPESNRARDVRDGLVAQAIRRGVDCMFNSRVTQLRPPADRHGTWQVVLDDGVIDASAVIIATGGLSVPATGSDGTGLRIVERLGHTINETYPALTPLTGGSEAHAALAGVALNVTLTAAGKKASASGGFLFTHRGYSGPAVLDISHHAVRARLHGGSQAILVQWTGEDGAAWDERLSSGGGATVGSVLRRTLPVRLADALIAEAGVDGAQPLATLRRTDRHALVEVLARYPLPWTGDEGYRKAEVTGGGVALAEVDPRTMESRVAPRLFLCGEILDAFGPIGGYNFAWAWATGRAAGLGAARQDGGSP